MQGPWVPNRKSALSPWNPSDRSEAPGPVERFKNRQGLICCGGEQGSLKDAFCPLETWLFLPK